MASLFDIILIDTDCVDPQCSITVGTAHASERSFSTSRNIKDGIVDYDGRPISWISPYIRYCFVSRFRKGVQRDAGQSAL